MTRILVVDDAHEDGVVGADSRDTVSDTTTLVVSWNTFSRATPTPSARVVHLGDLLHDREDALQQSLLQWLGKLADKHTSVDSPLPFVFSNLHSWWLLKISEKNYATTPEFTTLLKLSLLRDICEQHKVSRCDYFGTDQKLETALSIVVGGLNLETNARADAMQLRLRERLEVLQAIFHFLKAFGFATANLLRRPRVFRPRYWRSRSTTHFDGPSTKGGSAPPQALGFVGYLLPAATKDRAQSPYWGDLRESFSADQRSLWLYHRSDEVPWRSGQAFCAIRTSGHERHHLIDDFITFRVIFRSVRTYYKLARAHRSFSFDVPRPTASLGGLGAEHLFAAEIRDSLVGSHAVWSSIHAHTYESLVRASHVMRWFFLWENKGFEQSLVAATGRRGGVESVGYAHSVVRQRDHRYFNELRFAPVAGLRARPTASVYAVNGPLPLANIERIGAPDAPLRLVEALRYLSLTPRQATGSSVLVVGDISADESRRLVVATVESLRIARSSRRVIFKPHPGNLTQSDMARDLGCEVTTEPLAAIATSLSFAVVGVAGAASLDLTMLGVPVVTLLDARTMNLSPLAGVAGAVFARTSDDLRRFAEQSLRGTVDIDSVMTRSRPPVRWSALLTERL